MKVKSVVFIVYVERLESSLISFFASNPHPIYNPLGSNSKIYPKSDYMSSSPRWNLSLGDPPFLPGPLRSPHLPPHLCCCSPTIYPLHSGQAVFLTCKSDHVTFLLKNKIKTSKQNTPLVNSCCTWNNIPTVCLACTAPPSTWVCSFLLVHCPPQVIFFPPTCQACSLWTCSFV